MMRWFAWLVRHERLVVIVTALLLAVLALQLYFERPKSVPERTSSDGGSNAVPAARDEQLTGPVNVAGKWEMKVERRKQGATNWTLILEQDGEELEGVIKSDGGVLPVKGAIKGRHINLTGERFGMTVEFPATIEGEVMTGSMKALSFDRGWTARR